MGDGEASVAFFQDQQPLLENRGLTLHDTTTTSPLTVETPLLRPSTPSWPRANLYYMSCITGNISLFCLIDPSHNCFRRTPHSITSILLSRRKPNGRDRYYVDTRTKSIAVPSASPAFDFPSPPAMNSMLSVPFLGAQRSMSTLNSLGHRSYRSSIQFPLPHAHNSSSLPITPSFPPSIRYQSHESTNDQRTNERPLAIRPP